MCKQNGGILSKIQLHWNEDDTLTRGRVYADVCKVYIFENLGVFLKTFYRDQIAEENYSFYKALLSGRNVWSSFYAVQYFRSLYLWSRSTSHSARILCNLNGLPFKLKHAYVASGCCIGWSVYRGLWKNPISLTDDPEVWKMTVVSQKLKKMRTLLILRNNEWRWLCPESPYPVTWMRQGTLDRKTLKIKINWMRYIEILPYVGGYYRRCIKFIVGMLNGSD